jgi:crossover junction endodeoxyribonuclease RusA
MTDKVVQIIMPWPAKPLWQNVRTHWAKRSAAVKSYRSIAYHMALAQGLHKTPDPAALLAFSFHPPDRRRRDLHNMMATQKAAIDGIADAMRVDDQLFRCQWPLAWGEVVKGGAVHILVTAA